MKKSLSLLLSLVMILSVFTVLPVQFAAEDIDMADTGANVEVAETGNPYPTRQDTEYISPGVYGDGYYEIPCTWFAWQQAYERKGISLPDWGNAVNWWQGAKNAGYSTGSTPQPDSIAVWSGDYFGHVAYVTSVSGGNTFTVNEGGRTDLDQSDSHGIKYGYTITNAVGASRPYDTGKTLLGFIYLVGEPLPSNSWIKASHSQIPTGGSVTFTFGADNATGYTIGINKDGTRIITEGVTSGKTYTFSEEGNYTAYVTCFNSAGYVDSSKVSFTIFEPIILGDSFTAVITNSKGAMNISNTSDGNVILETQSENDNQKWSFVRQSDNTYKITNVGRNLCMDVDNANTASGTNIKLWSANTNNAQKFYIRDAGYGYALVPMVNTDLAIDIAAGKLNSGTNIQDYTWNGTYAQIFSIDYVGLAPEVTQDFHGHTYELYATNTSWSQAYRYCESQGGHLVTISSEEENNFIYDLAEGWSENIWLGAADQVSTGKWYWITGEPFTYTNWNSGEPNNTNSVEHWGCMFTSGKNTKTWNDRTNKTSNNNRVFFICEYDNDKVETESFQPTATITQDGIEYIVFDYRVDWQTAERICEAIGGHLVRIDNAEENQLVGTIMEQGLLDEYWIDATDRYREGTWTDHMGNRLSYTNWLDDEPNNDFNTEQYGYILKSSNKWADLKGYAPNYRKTGFICERKTVDKPVYLGDADGDGEIGSIDVTQIMRVVAHISTGIDDEVLMNADVDGNGELEIIDATYVQRHLAKMETPYQIGKAKG